MTEKIEEFNKLKDELESYANKLPSLKEDVLLSIFERSFKLIDNDIEKRRIVVVLTQIYQRHTVFGDYNVRQQRSMLRKYYQEYLNSINLNNIRLITNEEIINYLFDNFFDINKNIDFIENLKIRFEIQLCVDTIKSSDTNKFREELKNFTKTFKKINDKIEKFKKVIDASSRAYYTCATYLVLSIASFACAYWTFNHFDVGALFKNDIVKLYNKQPLYIFLTFIIYKLPTTLLCIIGLKLLFTSIKYENEGRKYKSLYTYIDFFNDFEKDEQKQVLKELSGYFFANDNDKKGEKTFAKFLKKIQLNINSNK